MTNSTLLKNKVAQTPFIANGNPIELPKDLYIPPEALRIFLEAFEGPLDLLLYLIKKQNIDIYDIPIAEVTRQYMEYIGIMKQLNWELAAEYLLMAAILAQIKSQMLLPKAYHPADEETLEEDPRQALIQKLQEYEQFKKAAQDIDKLPRIDRDIFPVSVIRPAPLLEKTYPQVTLEDILTSLLKVLSRTEKKISHRIKTESLSVKEKIIFLIRLLTKKDWTNFYGLLKKDEGVEGVVVVLMAILELIRQQMLEIKQSDCLTDLQCRML